MLENDQVRVLRIHYNPKEKSVMHEHPASVVVFLNTSKAKFTLPDGTTTTDGGGKAGSVRYADAGKHLPEVIGTVDQFLVNKHGEADGFLLTDGGEVHVPPHLSSRHPRRWLKPRCASSSIPT